MTGPVWKNISSKNLCFAQRNPTCNSWVTYECEYISGTVCVTGWTTVKPTSVSLRRRISFSFFQSDLWEMFCCCLTRIMSRFSSVSDADGSEGTFQLKKEHALRVLGYISSWTQRSVLLPLHFKLYISGLNRKWILWNIRPEIFSKLFLQFCGIFE